MADGVVELRVPPRAEYQRVVEAMATVVAGDADFTYDQVIQMRVAVGEVYRLAVASFPEEGDGDTPLLFLFNIYDDRVEITVTDHLDALWEYLQSAGAQEGTALVRGLVDAADFTATFQGAPAMWLLKRRPSL